jgi:hypothetical protein
VVRHLSIKMSSARAYERSFFAAGATIVVTVLVYVFETDRGWLLAGPYILFSRTSTSRTLVDAIVENNRYVFKRKTFRWRFKNFRPNRTAIAGGLSSGRSLSGKTDRRRHRRTCKITRRHVRELR